MNEQDPTLADLQWNNTRRSGIVYALKNCFLGKKYFQRIKIIDNAKRMSY
jgi:hypothetical protein